MHEVSLVSAAIAQAVDAARRAEATRVKRLTFVVAAGGHVTAEAVATLVAVLGRGTLVEGALVEVHALVDGVAGPALSLTSVDVELPAEGASAQVAPQAAVEHRGG
jgi:hypothetical protein